jgi:uncharacterized protein with PIN domain
MIVNCPDCENEILPYMKTGEFKIIEPEGGDIYLKSFQCYFCMHCKVVFYTKHEQYEFKEVKI